MVTHPSTNPAVHGRELNSQPVDHKSDALTTTLLCSMFVMHCAEIIGVVLFRRISYVLLTDTNRSGSTGMIMIPVRKRSHTISDKDRLRMQNT